MMPEEDATGGKKKKKKKNAKTLRKFGGITLIPPALASLFTSASFGSGKGDGAADKLLTLGQFLKLMMSFFMTKIQDDREKDKAGIERVHLPTFCYRWFVHKYVLQAA